MFCTMRCFPILNDAILRQFLKKNIDLENIDLENWNIMLTMHISDVFQTIKK